MVLLFLSVSSAKPVTRDGNKSGYNVAPYGTYGGVYPTGSLSSYTGGSDIFEKRSAEVAPSPAAKANTEYTSTFKRYASANAAPSFNCC